MNDTNPVETKVCPRCAETIKAAAKVCPFCQSHQSRWGLWKQELAMLACLLVLYLVSVLFFFAFLPDNDAFDNSTHPSTSNSLVTGQIAMERDDPLSRFWISGIVTNVGSHPWRVHGIEVRLLDSQGGLRDAIHPEIEEPFVVNPGQEHAFRVELGELIWSNTTLIPQVRVDIVSDGKRPMKN
jgi:hypothetical protein